MKINEMPKERTNYIRTFISIVVVVTSMYLLCSCSELDIKHDFDFTVIAMPTPKIIEEGEKIEMRIDIQSIGGSYDSNRYYMRYYLTDGKGILVYNDSVLKYNDSYLLSDKSIRMYYAATRPGSHELNMVFGDNNNYTHDLNFSFNKKDSTNNK